MRDVARAAGVAVETVYSNFGSKSELLLAAIDVAVVGDLEPIPLGERPEFAALGRGARSTREWLPRRGWSVRFTNAPPGSAWRCGRRPRATTSSPSGWPRGRSGDA